jgi:hypothetical protein
MQNGKEVDYETDDMVEATKHFARLTKLLHKRQFELLIT